MDNEKLIELVRWNPALYDRSDPDYTQPKVKGELWEMIGTELNTDGATWPIRHLSLRSILPNTEHYMTYEGSTTHPGCWETTVWIIINKPIYITKQEMYALRKLKQGSEKIPKAPLGNNARPLQPLHHRTVRTNIDFSKEQGPTQTHGETNRSKCDLTYTTPLQGLIRST